MSEACGYTRFHLRKFRIGFAEKPNSTGRDTTKTTGVERLTIGDKTLFESVV